MPRTLPCALHVPDLLLLQHQDDVPPGLLGGVLAAREAAGGPRVRTVRVDAEPLPSPTAGERIVVLGSYASAVGTGSQPWVADEVLFLRRAALAGVPILGICFGHQALAAALGGAVHRLDRPQVDWVTLASADPQAVPPGPWLAFHEDAVTPPPRARVLAQDAGGVQAFAAGPHLGVQFHPEATAEILDGWIAADRRDPRPYDPDRVRAGFATHGPAAARAALRLFSRWLGPVG
ncbi:hypothetical protein C7Y72_10790 [Paraconexibacter algicola]|uniref:Glutamine amidotransferase domain-containing protein n=1 Tax=Paraconexibacter algicola TaxID=2133960 RepID=A0A2T4ULH7_9ACTN|nr:hypothetical protein C7Y72_10790 [Paraconexibacter algicola]